MATLFYFVPLKGIDIYHLNKKLLETELGL